MKICVGIDAAKATHWTVGVDEAGRVVLDRAVENNPDAIDALVADLRRFEGEVVVGLDVVGSFAGFLEATLLAEGFALVHAPGIAVNRAGQGFAGGERKSDPKDARTIAELVRTRDLRPILPDDETRVALRLKVGRRRDLVADQTRRLSRLRGLLCGIHPGLERSLDVTCKGPLALLTRFVTPAEIRRAGKARIVAHLKRTPHLHGTDALAERALVAAQAQRIASPMSLGPLAQHWRPGEAATAELIRELAVEALETRGKIAGLDADLETLLAVHPDGALIRSLPGMGRCSRQSSSPAPATSAASPRPTRSPPPRASRRCSASPASAADGAAPSAATRHSSASSTRAPSAPSSPRTRSPGPSPTASAARGSITHKHSSPSRDGASR